jgi:uncharacterized protein
MQNSTSRSITPRAIDVDFTTVPRHWMAGHPIATHIINGVNLLFPIGERFFVRSVKAYLDQLGDPALAADVRAFFKQEGHHAHAHDRVNQMLRDHGFEIDRFLDRYEAILTAVEQMTSPQLRLAATAATEHFTAILAEGAFTSQMLEWADPQMKALLAWHALEEIEHRAVAFDVLQQVNPSYALRVAGLAFATAMLASMWTWATIMLLRQDPARRGAPAIARSRRQSILGRVFLRGIRDYLRPDFHPNQRDMDGVAAGWMKRHLTEVDSAVPPAA